MVNTFKTTIMQNDLELSTTGILSLFETSKSERATFVQDIVDRLINEEADPLKVHLQVKAMEEIINSLTCTDEKKNKTPWLAQTYKKLLLEAAEKHGKKFQYQNAEFTIKEVGSTYDFSQCNDSVLDYLQSQFDSAKAELEERKAFLKTVPGQGLEVVDGVTGELIKVYPPSKSSTTSVSVSLK